VGDRGESRATDLRPNALPVFELDTRATRDLLVARGCHDERLFLFRAGAKGSEFPGEDGRFLRRSALGRRDLGSRSRRLYFAERDRVA